MDTGSSAALGSQATPPPQSAPRGSRRVVGLGALLALAAAAGLVAWVLLDRSEDEPASPATAAAAPAATPTLPATPAETVSQPAFQSIPELRAAAAASAGPIYWVGARARTRLEVSETSGGTIFVRYLPLGTEAGDLEPHLTVATYARPNAFSEVQAAAENEGSKTVELDGGGIAVYDPAQPTNVHLAFPGEEYQVEVFSPEGGEALRLVENGKLKPVP